jgi:hypothetical protein
VDREGDPASEPIAHPPLLVPKGQAGFHEDLGRQGAPESSQEEVRVAGGVADLELRPRLAVDPAGSEVAASIVPLSPLEEHPVVQLERLLVRAVQRLPA